MVVLITGSGGFVGNYLVKELRSNAPDDLMICGVSNEKMHPDIAGMLDESAEIDILDYQSFRDFLAEKKPDHIYHLAAQSSVAVSLEKPVETYKINLMGTINLVEIALSELKNRSKLLLVLSADIYKCPVDGESIDENSPMESLNPYSVSKAGVDFLANIYSANHDLDIIRARSFNHIGTGQSTTFVMPSFARQIARIESGLEEPVLKVGNLNVWRDFTDVRDVVRAYTLLMEKGQPGEAYNICSGHAYSIKEMLDLLLEMSNVSIEVLTVPSRMRQADNPKLLGDNTKLRKQTGWKPQIPIKNTLEDLLNHWRSKVRNEEN